MPDHEAHDHHDHHDHGAGPLTLEQRHAHEAQTYDRMADEIRSTWTDPDYVVSPEAIPFANREHVDFLTDAIGRLGPLQGRRILEVGAGGGSLAVWLAHQGAEVVGIDVSPGILDVARRRAEASGVADRTRFVCRPIEHFVPADEGLGDLRFDGIIGNNVVHHFERDLALARIGELLAPGARAVFCEPILLLPEWVRTVRNSRLVRSRFPLHTHSPDERSLGEEDFATMRRHFDVVDWTPYQVLCRLQNFVELSDPAWHRLERWDRSILAHVPGARRVSRMAVITLAGPIGPPPSTSPHTTSETSSDTSSATTEGSTP
ncbi:MAG: Ubiquinone biosynthesis O-methyltransferase [Humibacillus sp.]|nr:Ubiquinone biosynthesis O-methyltransferase [Humibacillus sp.]